ncbi:MAG: hypothetical protein QGH39_00695, partial [Candidatus Thermoplasmatota archaeon]|nr:hypothetical protein [Candidatus Thermoplasmatota archaeon]
MLKRPPFNSSFTIMILVTIMLLCFQMIGNIEFSLSQTAAADNNWEPFWDSDFDDWTLSDLIIDWDGNLTLERVSGNYSGSGNATSTPMNTGADGIWKTLNWEASTAQNTSVSFQIRNGSSLAECNSNRFSGPNGLDS